VAVIAQEKLEPFPLYSINSFEKDISVGTSLRKVFSSKSGAEIPKSIPRWQISPNVLGTEEFSGHLTWDKPSFPHCVHYSPNQYWRA